MILSIDPGSANFAWSLVDHRRIIDNGMTQVRASDITAEVITATSSVIFGLVTDAVKRGAKRVIWERYQTRGSASKNNETVNLVIGQLASLALSAGLELLDPVPPPLWKGWWNRLKLGKDPWYAALSEAVPGSQAKTVHMKDAIGIGYWALAQESLVPVPGPGFCLGQNKEWPGARKKKRGA